MAKSKLTNQELVNVFTQSYDSTFAFRERRVPDWNESYLLYRDKVQTNRLTQRQSVNIPLMKSTIASLLKEIDNPPNIYFDSLDNDEQGEIFYNVFWKEMAKANKLDVRDVMDKKQVLLYGRSFKKLNIVDGKFSFEVIDPLHMLVDRTVDPADLDTASVVIQTDIIKTMKEIEANDEYNQETVNTLKEFFLAQQAELLESSDNQPNEKSDKVEKAEGLDMLDAWNPVMAESEVELQEMYHYDWSPEKETDVLYISTFAAVPDVKHLLLSKPLFEVIGETEDDFWCYNLPYSSWGSDEERTDFWSDGVADAIRTLNNVLNSWFSQMVENRTLRNFGMNYFDATKKDFAPQSFIPEAWGWYPTQGNPNEVMKSVEIPDLSSSLLEVEFALKMAERASSSTGVQRGEVSTRDVTLGEVQIALTEAKETIKSIEVFYMESWKNFALKYTKMIEANIESGNLSELEITKKGRRGIKNYTRLISPEDLRSLKGFRPEVKTLEDKQGKQLEDIQKLQAIKAAMQDNVPLDAIYKNRLVEFGGLTADEMEEVMEFEKEKRLGLPALGPGGVPTPELIAPSAPAPVAPVQGLA